MILLGERIKSFKISGYGFIRRFYLLVCMSAVPFSFMLAAILKNEYRDWVKQAMPMGSCRYMCSWVSNYAWWLLGLQHSWMGRILGMGSVENSSLVPWIIGVASIPTILVQKKTERRR